MPKKKDEMTKSPKKLPYKALPRPKVRLPNRQKAGDYRDPQHEVARVKEHF